MKIGEIVSRLDVQGRICLPWVENSHTRATERLRARPFRPKMRGAFGSVFYELLQHDGGNRRGQGGEGVGLFEDRAVG